MHVDANKLDYLSFNPNELRRCDLSGQNLRRSPTHWFRVPRSPPLGVGAGRVSGGKWGAWGKGRRLEVPL